MNIFSVPAVGIGKIHTMAIVLDIKDTQEAYVKSAIHHRIAKIEFFHSKSNCLQSKQLAALAHEITYAGNNDNIHAIVLQSAGDGVFCAGASIDELRSIENEKQGSHFFGGFANVLNAIRKCPKFVIARVQGKCIGGGVGLAAAADYAIAMEGSSVRLSELSIGIGSFVVGPAIERKIGLSAYSQLCIDAAEWRSSEWARRKGLFAEIHATVEELDEAVARITNQLAHYNPEAMVKLKKTFWQGAEHWEQLLHERAELSGKMIVTEYAKDLLRQIKL